ncbi:MAG: rhomboid family intramembrane serine protease [Saprospiraceae bacterium]|nr:rhomboid family intramembrane serine protease [Saprospiraceae bacterium]MCB0575401.1 rhomboid family intramembrane serine protease [Saprospiraceae bacterium]MCB9356291.1 rhomboid family intramembrane serine protease [Lewinellaceae bacterium]
MIFPVGDDNVEGGHPPVLSYGFLLLNVGVFLFQNSLPKGTQAAFVETWGAIPYEIAQGVDLQTLVTSIFLHGSWLHLLTNMLYLWIFADNIEAVVGSGRFLIFYLFGGMVAGLAQVVFNPLSGMPCVGASGAIAAVMGAYVVMFPGSRIKMLFILLLIIFYIPSWIFLGVWFLQQTLAGLEVLGMSSKDAGGIAWWAHIGGFLFGLAMGIYFRSRYHTTRIRLH